MQISKFVKIFYAVWAVVFVAVAIVMILFGIRIWDWLK